MGRVGGAGVHHVAVRSAYCLIGAVGDQSGRPKSRWRRWVPAVRKIVISAVVLPSVTPVLLSVAGLEFSRMLGDFGLMVLIDGPVTRKISVSS